MIGDPSTTKVRPVESLLVCPACRGGLKIADDDSSAECMDCRAAYGSDSNGLWHFMSAEADEKYRSFCREYRSIREAEGWASGDGDYYRRLPDVAEGNPQRSIWRLRQRSFSTFLVEVLEPVEEARGRPLTIVDAGAGNGWLSNHLAHRGHDVIAVDLQADGRHGLRACVHYEAKFLPVRATFARLPLADGTADLVVFSASLHYADDVSKTVAESVRVLTDGGHLIVLDSPVYGDADSGRQMVESSKEYYRDRYGDSLNGSPGRGFLTWRQLEVMRARFDLEWNSIDPGFGLRHAVEQWAVRLRTGRETAGMPVLVGRRSSRDSLPVPSAHERHTWIVQKLAYLWRWLRAILFLRRRYDTYTVETVCGFSLLVLPGVFNPALFDSSKWFAELIGDGKIDLGRRVLDMGTGAGLTAVAAAAHGCHVTAVDINPAAVRSVRKNALVNALADGIEVRTGDLFDGVKGEEFDTVFFNPPFYEGAPTDGLDRAWRGKGIAARFAAGLKSHLSPSGKAYVVLSSRGAPEAFLQAFREQGLTIEVFRTYDLVCETQVVYRISQPDESPW